MPIVTISAEGSVVIPEEIRKKYGWKQGDKVHLIDFAGRVAIAPVAEDPAAAGWGMLKGGPSMTEGLLEDRRWELEREERGLPPPPGKAK